jgi:excisionase family DNA binding protein
VRLRKGGKELVKSPSLNIEDIVNTMSAAVARAMKGLREVSDAVAELRDAEMMLRGLAASQMIAAKDRKPSNDENSRLAYRVDEAAKALGLSRKTINRRIADGTLASTKKLGRRLVSVESAKALF